MKVAIIGAGISGLVTAHRLRDAGHEIVVFEARDRVGGRMRSLREGFEAGQYADVGAEVIYHGQDHIVELCQRFGLELTPPMSLGAEVPDLVFGGRKLEASESAQIVTALREKYAAFPPDAWETLAAWAHRVDLGPAAYALVDTLVQSTPLTPLRYVDAREFNPHLGWSEGYRKIAGGNDQLPERMAEGLGVRLREPIRRVAWGGEGVELGTDDATHRADRVVVCVPGPLTTELGFDPPLPARKVRALLELRYGNGTRVALQYAERDAIRRAMGGGAFTDRVPFWLFDQSLYQPGDPIVVTSLLGGDHEPRLTDEEQILREADETLSMLAGQPVRRLFGKVISWSADPWARCVVRAPIGDQRESLIPILAEPLDNKVFFAGEHIDDRVGPGGMEGAIKSAMRATELLSSAS